MCGFVSLTSETYTVASLLQGEEEFRDKLSPIYISLNFSLDPQATVAQHGLRPILNYQTEQLIEQKVSIFLLIPIHIKATPHTQLPPTAPM